jgi:hypothetical protein
MPVSMIVLVDGVALSYAKQGSELGHAVVLLPGSTDPYRSYEPVLGGLPDDLGTVAVSLRGPARASTDLAMSWRLRSWLSERQRARDGIEVGLRQQGGVALQADR